MGLYFIGLLVVFTIGVILFVNLSPVFGGKSSEEQKESYKKSENYEAGKFLNTTPINMDMSMKDMGKAMFGMMRKTPNTTPNGSIPIDKIEATSIASPQDSTHLYWFGHSTFLVQIGNKNILIDPMFGEVPAPHPMLGTKRFGKELPIEIAQLPKIDAVLLSHDHYDHLDYGSIQKLKGKVDKFYTPLGLSVHLEKWGIDKDRIIELDWWQETNFQDLTFKCTPAQHFSGRKFSRNETLWCSWIIESETDNIFFSGDSGYGSHFKEIGEKYGPFDFAMLECGQYNELWPDVHMFPEQTVQAGVDLKAKQFMPIHWGAFKIAMHTWTDPIERVSKKAQELQLKIVTPKIGEPIILQNQILPKTQWWKSN